LSLQLIQHLHRQIRKKKQFIKASIGIGGSTPFDDVDTYSNGFFAQGEFVYEVYSWLDLRPYAGVIFASTDDEDNKPSEKGFISDTNAFMIGGKARIIAPIPWVAPYVEIGIGTSFGKFETLTNITNINKSGMQFHIPLSLGLEIGRKHNFELAITYYLHFNVEQIVGAAALGVTFPLN
jgi:hypothetical protein